MRKNSFHISLSILWLITGVPSLTAQETYDVKGLVNKVIQDNYHIRISRNEERIASANNTLGQAGFLPQLSLEAGQNLSLYDTRQELFTGAIREGSSARSTALSALVNVNWTIFDGFKMFAQRDRLGYLEALGAMDTRYLIEQTIRDVSIAYFQLVKERALLKSMEDNLQTSRFRYQLEKKRLELGAGNALQLNQSQVDYYSDSVIYIEQLNLTQSLNIQINTYLLKEPGSVLTLADQGITEGSLPSKSAVLDHALNKSPDILRAQLEELMSSVDVRIQRADLFPQLDLFGRYSYAYQTSEVGFAETSRTLGPQFGISIRLNLFNGGIERKELRNTSIMQENAGLARENQLLMLRAAVEDLYGRYQAYARQLSLAKENLDLATRSLSIARTQLEQGTISGYDFRLTQVSRINALNAITRLEYLKKATEIELDRLGGQLAAKYL